MALLLVYEGQVFDNQSPPEEQHVVIQLFNLFASLVCAFAMGEGLDTTGDGLLRLARLQTTCHSGNPVGNSAGCLAQHTGLGEFVASKA
jgi:hypothetical protein